MRADSTNSTVGGGFILAISGSSWSTKAEISKWRLSIANVAEIIVAAGDLREIQWLFEEGIWQKRVQANEHSNQWPDEVPVACQSNDLLQSVVFLTYSKSTIGRSFDSVHATAANRMTIARERSIS